MTFDTLIWLVLLVAVTFMMARNCRCCGDHTNESFTANNKKQDIP